MELFIEWKIAIFLDSREHKHQAAAASQLLMSEATTK